MPVLEDALEEVFDSEILAMLLNVQEMVHNHPGMPFTEQDLLYLLTVTLPEDKWYLAHVERMRAQDLQPIPRDKYNTMWSITGKKVYEDLTAPGILHQLFQTENVHALPHPALHPHPERPVTLPG